MRPSLPSSEGAGPRWTEVVAGYALIAAPAFVLFVLVLMPAALSVVGTVTVRTEAGTHFGLEKYAAFFGDAYSRANLVYTITQTLAATSTALGLSLLIALYLRFGTGRVAALVQTLALFPLFVPAIIVSYALIRFLGPNGAFQIVIENLGITGYRTPYLTPVGPYIAFVWEAIPLPVLVITAGLAQVSEHSIEAARDLGAGWGRILYSIVLPQARRSLLVAFSLTFLGIFGSYTVPYLLGPAAPEMMGVFMQRTFGQLMLADEAEVQAVVSFLVCAVVGALYVRLITETRR